MGLYYSQGIFIMGQFFSSLIYYILTTISSLSTLPSAHTIYALPHIYSSSNSLHKRAGLTAISTEHVITS